MIESAVLLVSLLTGSVLLLAHVSRRHLHAIEVERLTARQERATELWQQADFAEAAGVYEVIARTLRRQLGASHLDLVGPLYDLGVARAVTGQLDAAADAFAKAAELVARGAEDGSLPLAPELWLARLAIRRGDVEAALRACERACVAAGDRHDRRAEAQEALRIVERRRGRQVETERRETCSPEAAENGSPSVIPAGSPYRRCGGGPALTILAGKRCSLCQDHPDDLRFVAAEQMSALICHDCVVFCLDILGAEAGEAEGPPSPAPPDESGNHVLFGSDVVHARVPFEHETRPRPCSFCGDDPEQVRVTGPAAGLCRACIDRSAKLLGASARPGDGDGVAGEPPA
jgi:hypothetical protein